MGVYFHSMRSMEERCQVGKAQQSTFIATPYRHDSLRRSVSWMTDPPSPLYAERFKAGIVD
jgi:hypothetical protein